MKDTFVLVLGEQRVGIIDEETKHALARCSGLEVFLELELKVNPHAAASQSYIGRLVVRVLEEHLEAEPLNVEADRFGYVTCGEHWDDRLEFGVA